MWTGQTDGGSYQGFLLCVIGIIAAVHVIGIATEATCPMGSFTCHDGSCIHVTWKCDTEPDCPSGEDEDRILCGITCPAGHFSCNDGTCISNTWRCDGARDCSEGEDEPDYCELMSCPVNSFTCTDGGGCITAAWRCDGEDDCDNGSDEVNCDPFPAVCEENQFRCDDGTCLSERWRCDGDYDCPDRSDEANCNPCESYGFHCHSGECTSNEFVCDGVGDCKDSSDELNCVTTTETTTVTTTQTQSITTQTTPTRRATTTKASTQLNSYTRVSWTELSTTKAARQNTRTVNAFTPYRLEGRVAGIVNGIPLEEIKMSCHGADQEKSYISFHPVPPFLMTSLYPIIIEMTSLMGWMLAAKEEISGFAFTEGKCTRRSHITFETGNNVTILQKYQGKTGHSIAVHTYIEGSVPVTNEVHHQKITLDNDDRYAQKYPGMLYSSTSRQFNIGSDVIKYTSKQHISFDALLAAVTLDSSSELVMNISDVTVTYDNITDILRLGMATRITMSSVKQIFPHIQPNEHSQNRHHLHIYIVIAGSLTFVFIALITVVCVIKRRRKPSKRGLPSTLPSSQAENRAYMEMGSAAIYEEIPSRAFDSDYVSPDDITCHKDQDGTFCNRRVMNNYSDIDYEVPKSNGQEVHDHKGVNNNNTANGNVKGNGVLMDGASMDKYYLSPCYMGANGTASGHFGEDGYMEPGQLKDC